MPLHVLLTVGPNSFDVTGDVPFEQIIDLARLWLSAVAPDTLQSALDKASERVQAMDTKIRDAVAADAMRND